MKPTIGRIVYYMLSAQDVVEIEKQRKDSHHACAGDELAEKGSLHVLKGNPVSEGMLCQASIRAVWSDTCVNLVVGLDGNDTLWVTSASLDQDGKAPRTWHWMDVQLQQAAEKIASETGKDVAVSDLVGSGPEKSWTGPGPAPDVATGVHSRCGQSAVLDGGEVVATDTETGKDVTLGDISGEDTSQEQSEHPAAEEEQADAAEDREA